MSKRHNTTATARLKQDYLRLKRDPVPYITAEPLPSNLLEWHYAVKGPENSPYEGGVYHGKLIFPKEFPFKPPSIFMITPNGRFKCNTRLCLSMSDFHPDSWNPAWSVATILTGLLSFMLEKSPTLGSIDTSEFSKRQFAHQSLVFNLNDKLFVDLFPDLIEEMEEELKKREDELKNSSHEVASGKDVTPVSPTLMNGAMSNILIVTCFAIFVYAVKYIMKDFME